MLTTCLNGNFLIFGDEFVRTPVNKCGGHQPRRPAKRPVRTVEEPLWQCATSIEPPERYKESSQHEHDREDVPAEPRCFSSGSITGAFLRGAAFFSLVDFFFLAITVLIIRVIDVLVYC